MKRLISFITTLYDKNLLRDYSSKHMLIKALKSNKFDFFDNYKAVNRNSIFNFMTCDIATTFLINFSQKLYLFSTFLEEKDFERFITDQLSAGKSKYNEDQFIRAVSEVNVLNYFFQYVSLKFTVIYEPNINGDGKNPEARIITEDGTIYDIEVKTPGFNKDIELGKFNYLLKPNAITSHHNLRKLKTYCKKQKIKLMLPRVLKIKEFIKSAASKFENIKHPHHYNILVINWTYSKFGPSKLHEPIGLLTNHLTGILEDNNSLDKLKISSEEIGKISSIIVYSDNVDSILSQDFRFHFSDKSVYLIGNEILNKINDYDFLYKTLGFPIIDRKNPINDWYPSDYLIRDGNPVKIIEDAQVFFYELLSKKRKSIQTFFEKFEKY